MNENCNDSSLFKKAITVGAIGYGIVNHKRILTQDNLDIVTDVLTKQRFDKVKKQAVNRNSMLSNVNMKTQNIFNMHYSANRRDSSIRVLGPLKGTLGLDFLRISNDPVYQQASKAFNRNATNQDMLDYILAHEFGHHDHFTRNIGYDMSGVNLLDGNFNRKRYKEKNPYEQHADYFARKILG